MFALYQVVSNGVEEIAMASFGVLPAQDRWALAFFVGTLSYMDDDTAAGAKLWQSSAAVRQSMAGLDVLTQTSEHTLAGRLDEQSARAVMAYLHANPQVLAANKPGGTAIAKAKIAQSLLALQDGDRASAGKFALSAYLDGFEPLEPAIPISVNCYSEPEHALSMAALDAARCSSIS